MTMREILLDRDYEFPLQRRVEVIVDAGANIGLASVYFANAYPDAKIIAIEPEKDNFLLLKRNVESYPQVTTINAALWRSSGQIRLIDPGRGDHGFVTAEESSAEGALDERVSSLSMDDLMDACGMDHIDLLKVDIEGAEKEVFESAGAWMDRVSVIVIELHERLKPACVQAFSQATRRMRTVLERGKLVVKAADPR